MQVTLHAILLIVLPVAALLSVVALGRRVPTGRQFVVALILASLGTLAAPMFNQHMCLAGEPRNQWLILGPCLFLALLLVDSAARRRWLAACVFVGMMGLSCHFTNRVHTPGWTGTPGRDRGAQARLRSLQESAEAAVADIANQDAALTAGWLRDSAIWDDVEDVFGDKYPNRCQDRRVWHSALTGLYQTTCIPQDFWYPGGPPKEAVTRIELHDRALRR